MPLAVKTRKRLVEIILIMKWGEKVVVDPAGSVLTPPSQQIFTHVMSEPPGSQGGKGGHLEPAWPAGADFPSWWGTEQNRATSFLWGCRIMKDPYLRRFFWGSNVHWRQRTDKPCEEVEPERIEPKVCCPSESLLMGHGGPLIPLGLFLSLPQKDSLVLLQIPPWGSEIVSSEGVFTDAGLQEAAGCPEESRYSSLDYGAGGEYHGWPSGPLKELQASVVLWPAATFSIFWRWRITTPRKLTVRAELTATGASW